MFIFRVFYIFQGPNLPFRIISNRFYPSWGWACGVTFVALTFLPWLNWSGVRPDVWENLPNVDRWKVAMGGSIFQFSWDGETANRLYLSKKEIKTSTDHSDLSGTKFPIHKIRSNWSNQSLGIQSPCQMMIGVYNHLLSKVFRLHFHSQKVIGSLGNCIKVWNIK